MVQQFIVHNIFKKLKFLEMERLWSSSSSVVYDFILYDRRII